MISLFLFESDVYWKIWGIKMFNQCFLEYFPSFRMMLWACDCPVPGEFVHECELQQGYVQAPWYFLFYALILCAF